MISVQQRTLWTNLRDKREIWRRYIRYLKPTTGYSLGCIKTQSTLMEKLANDAKSQFTEVEIQKIKMCTQRCSNVLVIKEMEI